jgi:hypothetical protein
VPKQFIIMGAVTPIVILNLNRIFIQVSLAVYTHVITVRANCSNTEAVHIAIQGIYVLLLLRYDSAASEDSDRLRPDALFLV